MVTRIGVAGVAAVFATGLWLVAAPFALGYQHAGTVATSVTLTDVITGCVLAMAGFSGLLAVIAGRVGELYADARSCALPATAADRENSRR